MNENVETRSERELRELRESCMYDESPDFDDPEYETKSSVDSLIEYKNALEDAYAALIDAQHDRASISFRGESSESFANMLQHIDGYTVYVTPNNEDDPAGREPFDGTVCGSAADVTGDYYGVYLRRYDEEAGEPVGDPFAVIVRDLLVY